jgi:hypothetical protein
MSFESVAWALEQPIGGTQKILLLGIASHADKFGDNAWPSIDTLAKYAFVDPRSVQRCIGDLIRLGYVFREINEGGSRKTAPHMRPNLYRLNMAGKPVVLTEKYPLTPASPPDASVTPPPDASVTPPPDASVTTPLTPVSPEQSIEPSIEQSIKNTSAQARLSPAKNSASKPDDVDEQVWQDFLVIRRAKKAPLTPTAFDGICANAAKAGFSVDAALRVCCERGWSGFKADWVADKSNPKPALQKLTFAERDRIAGMQRWEESCNMQHPDLPEEYSKFRKTADVIDITPQNLRIAK